MKKKDTKKKIDNDVIIKYHQYKIAKLKVNLLFHKRKLKEELQANK